VCGLLPEVTHRSKSLGLSARILGSMSMICQPSEGTTVIDNVKQPVTVLRQQRPVNAVHQVCETLHHRRLFLRRQRTDDFLTQLRKVLQTIVITPATIK